MWKWQSMKGVLISLPAASITCPAAVMMPGATAAILSPLMAISASVPSGLTPPLIRSS
jgi:hypothetical protein